MPTNPLDILMQAETKTLLDAMVLVKDLSSGKVKTKILSKPVEAGGYGHPYGILPGKVRKPPPYGRFYWDGLPAKINKQTGLFFSSWKSVDPSHSGDSIKSAVYNTAPYADELATGTDLQMARPLPDLAAYKLSRPRIKNIIEAIIASGDSGIKVKY